MKPPCKPFISWCYVNDTAILCDINVQKAKYISQGFECRNESINFILEIEENNKLAFLDFLINNF